MNQIKLARAKKGYTLNDMENLTGMSCEAYRKIEEQITKKPQNKNLYTICQILDLDFEKVVEEYVKLNYESKIKTIAKEVKNTFKIPNQIEKIAATEPKKRGRKPKNAN